MDAKSSRKRLIFPIAAGGAGAAGFVTAMLVAILPADVLEAVSVRSGLPAILAAAEPPLGTTARLILILIGGGTLAMVAWAALSLVFGRRRLAIRLPGGGDRQSSVPVLRRADAHPDAPPREPVLAHRDLGTPFLDVRAKAQPTELAADADPDHDPLLEPLPLPVEERTIPRDLDQPLAAFDPGALLPTPMAPAVALPPIAKLPPRPPVLDAGERFETFPLSPAPPTSTPAATADDDLVLGADTRATITALLERLERGVTQRTERATLKTGSDSIAETLNSLRRMASVR